MAEGDDSKAPESDMPHSTNDSDIIPTDDPEDDSVANLPAEIARMPRDVRRIFQAFSATFLKENARFITQDSTPDFDVHDLEFSNVIGCDRADRTRFYGVCFVVH